MHKHFKRLLPELKQQAEWTLGNVSRVYPERRITKANLCINPAAGLDPFSMFGKCFAPDCRMLNADQIARTVGLYADVALIGDSFTDLIFFTQRWERMHTFRLMGDILVLTRLLPLFHDGIFRFVSNFGGFCKKHKQMFDAQVESLCDQLAVDIESTVRYGREGDFLTIESAEFAGVPVVHTRKLSASDKRKLEGAADLKDVGLPLFRNLPRSARGSFQDAPSSRARHHVFEYSNVANGRPTGRRRSNADARHRGVGG